jgi:hypothetical protein
VIRSLGLPIPLTTVFATRAPRNARYFGNEIADSKPTPASTL